MSFLRVLAPSGSDRDNGDDAGDGLRALIAECGFIEDPDAFLDVVEASFDTWDGRLRRAGALLVHRAVEGTWILSLTDGRALRAAGPSRPPKDGPLGRAIRRLARGQSLIPWLGWRREERLFRGPLAGFDEPPVLRWQEFRFLDLQERRAVRGPRVVRIETAGAAIPPGAATPLASRLASMGNASFDPVEAGCTALGIPVPAEEIPDALRLRADDPPDGIVRTVLAREARHLARHARGAIHDLDPEFVHQLRVGSRRARAALRLLRDHVTGPRLEAIRAELGWLGETLGWARDLDVMLAAFPARARRAHLSADEADAVRTALAARRRAAYDEVSRALRSARFAALLTAMRGGVPSARADGMTAAVLAPELVERAIARVRKRGRGPAHAIDDRALHAIRIAIKRLRYVGEFFADFQDPRFTRSVRALVRYQDCLGELNDAIIAEARLRDIATVFLADRVPVDRILALGALIGVERRRAAKRRSRFETMWADFPAAARRIHRRLVRAGGAPEAGVD